MTYWLCSSSLFIYTGFISYFLAFGWVEGHVPGHAIAKETKNAKNIENAQDLVLEIETVNANVTEKNENTAIGGRTYLFSTNKISGVDRERVVALEVQ